MAVAWIGWDMGLWLPRCSLFRNSYGMILSCIWGFTLTSVNLTTLAQLFTLIIFKFNSTFSCNGQRKRCQQLSKLCALFSQGYLDRLITCSLQNRGYFSRQDVATICAINTICTCVLSCCLKAYNSILHDLGERRERVKIGLFDELPFDKVRG